MVYDQQKLKFEIINMYYNIMGDLVHHFERLFLMDQNTIEENIPHVCNM